MMLMVVALTAAACGGDDGGDSANGTIVVTNAWARSSAAMANAGAVYMTIENTGGADDALLDVAVDPSVAASAELHEVVMGDGASSTTMTGEMGDGMSSTTMAGDMGDGMSSTTMAGDMGGNTMTMQEVDQIDLPAGVSVKLEPGAYHVMLLDLAAPLETGTTIAVTLTFEHAAMFAVNAEVRAE